MTTTSTTRRVDEREARAITRFSATWAISLIGSLISLVATIACMLEGVSGALSVALGIAGIATSLLLEALQKLIEIRDENNINQRHIEDRLRDTAAALTANTATFNIFAKGTDLGDLTPEIQRIAAIAHTIKKDKLDPVFTERAISAIQTTLDGLSSLHSGRLQLDFTFSNLLLDVMRAARNEVLGTSPADVEDTWWHLPLYQEYLEIQENLIKVKDVKITRIFMSRQITPELIGIMKGESALGIVVRYVDMRRIQKPLQEAYVVFDRRIMHRTVPTIEQEDDNFFSQNATDVNEYVGKFNRLLPFSQSLESLRIEEATA